MHQIIRKAFTLIELLVVIAIIGILSGLIVVSMGGMTQKATITKAQVFSNSLRNSLLNNIVAQYSFDDITDYNTSTKVLNSTAGNVPDSWSTNEGQAYGGPILKEGNDCVSGKCLSFDGNSDYVNCGNKPNLKDMSALTIEAWIKGVSYVHYAGVVSKWSWHNQQHYDFGYFENGSSSKLGNIFFGVASTLTDDTGLDSIASITNLDLNKWYHVVGSFEGSSFLKIYINGILDNSKGTTTTKISNGSYNTAIGVYANYFFNGIIDNVRIYNATIQASQIKENYYSGLNSLFINGGITKEEYLSRINSYAKN